MQTAKFMLSLRKGVFVSSGMKAKDTIAAEMAFMFGERNEGKSSIDYPLEGSKSIVDALVRGIKKHGGKVQLRAPVEEIVVEGSSALPLQSAQSSGSQRALKIAPSKCLFRREMSVSRRISCSQ